MCVWGGVPLYKQRASLPNSVGSIQHRKMSLHFFTSSSTHLSWKWVQVFCHLAQWTFLADCTGLQLGHWPPTVHHCLPPRIRLFQHNAQVLHEERNHVVTLMRWPSTATEAISDTLPLGHNMKRPWGATVAGWTFVCSVHLQQTGICGLVFWQKIYTEMLENLSNNCCGKAKNKSANRDTHSITPPYKLVCTGEIIVHVLWQQLLLITLRMVLSRGLSE